MSSEPENLILHKLNRALAWMEVRGKQIDQLVEENKAIKGAVWANDRAVNDVRAKNVELDTRVTTLELDQEDERSAE